MRIVDEIEHRIVESEEGSLFFVSDFAKSGNDVFISRLLSGFVEKGLLFRISQGIYYKPVKTRLGILLPDVSEIVKAIARRDDAQILPTGETAQYLLGLSTQMPMSYIYLTSGSARKIVVGSKIITFRRCVPKNFICDSELLATLIQAMRSIGKDRITEEHEAIIKELLRKNLPIESMSEDVKVAPIWIRKIITNILKDIDYEKVD